METFIGQFDWEFILIVSVAASFVIEAIDRVTPEWVKGKWLLAIIALIVTILKSDFDFSSMRAIQDLIFDTLITVSVAILFYTYIGRWTVEKIMSFIKSKTEKQLPQ